ncbi:hypothetical protein [Paraburkholderia sp. GAS41]|uniref:hypothetical protein n=1 Tax=Paraburkholderia sp. GAS41 TaxID=3035134 RepID=UPI003D1B70CB
MNADKPDDNGSVSSTCATYMLEHAARYDLLFSEFDDQGWANNPKKIDNPILHTMQAGPRDPSTAFGNLKKFLDDQAKNHDRLMIITFVHGWKHNASTDDTNVKLFRQVLENTATLEEKTNSGRHVVGVYLGWRGDSLNVPDGIKSVLTFYDRKDTADEVSKGAIHEVIAYLNAYERRENRLSDGQCDVASASEGCKVVSVFIGHSFGGLILYEAIAPAVLSSVIDGEVYSKSAQPPPVERFGDMVLLINPAIEAARFQPLFRSVATYQPKKYKSPLMVLVTTDADVATGTFFPLGRFFSTFFEAKDDQEQRDAVLETIGHMKPYVTHYLHHFDTTPLGNVGDAPGIWPRRFGDGNVLYVCDKEYASYPVWNIETDKSVMKGHSDLDNPNLRNFVVALIDDAIVQSERMKNPPPHRIQTGAAQGDDVPINCLSSDNYDRLKAIDPAKSN